MSMEENSGLFLLSSKKTETIVWKCPAHFLHTTRQSNNLTLSPGRAYASYSFPPSTNLFFEQTHS